jgi:hypothetical protein
LGKWLYLSQAHPEFESVAVDLAALALKRDPRLGVESKVRMRLVRRPSPDLCRTRRLWFRCPIIWHSRCQPANHEFLE